MSERKKVKARKRRKAYEKEKHRRAVQRKRIKREGGMKIKITRKQKVFCKECSHAKRNKKATIPGKCFYCEIYDKERYDENLLVGWGKFEGNKTGDCLKFKKKAWLKRLLQ